MIPNLISISRILLLFPILYLILFGHERLALALFILACFTDFLDGYLARLLNQETILGENLDLLADKIFITIILIFLPFHYDNFLILIFSMLLISRELMIGSVRQYFLSIDLPSKTKVNYLGKLKTFLQMFSIGSSIILLNSELEFVAIILFFIATFVSWVSLINYIKN